LERVKYQYLTGEGKVTRMSRVNSGFGSRKTDVMYVCKQYLAVRCDTYEYDDTFKA